MSRYSHHPQGFGRPQKQGLYDPRFEKDSCGVGFVAHINGVASHQIIVDAEHALCRMHHRGGTGSEANTGDGAGMLTGLPHEFFADLMAREFDLELPKAGHYAVGNVFLPTAQTERILCKDYISQLIADIGLKLIAWREVPIDPKGANVGSVAMSACPHIEQLFVCATDSVDQEELERRVSLLRKKATRWIRENKRFEQAEAFYICSLSSKTIVYKGMLNGEQVFLFYPDLRDDRYKSHLAMVHSRFSTNTFPSWDRAQPLRLMSHNGEINTFQGNLNWMRTRQAVVKSEQFGDRVKELFPVIEPDVSDSGAFDNVLEFLMLNGRSLQESVSLMVPEAWQNDAQMSQLKRDFYEYNSMLMEPWDGPASIAFTDGRYIGAVLDRNGLRPSRFYLTHDDHVIMASEVGVVPVDPANVKYKGRLRPGKMFLLDVEQGSLVNDEALKNSFANRNPYGDWLQSQRIELEQLHTEEEAHGFDELTLLPRMQAFGYSVETMQFMLLPLVREMRDPVGSMGNDAALACLSDKPRMLYDYFKQLFAQVTNPPIDSIREEVVMSLACYIGPEGNLLSAEPEHAHRLRIPHPIISNEELAALKHIDHKHLEHRRWQARTIDLTYPKAAGPEGLEDALTRICEEASQAIADDYSLIILSDRNIGAERIPVSTLLASASVHHHLVRRGERTRIGIVLETGEACEVHHHCLLVGYGADAINPYLAFEALWHSQRENLLPGEAYDHDDKIVEAYRKAVGKGMLKVMAKMGISTLQSYKGAQIFEAVGLADEVVNRCFTGTASRIGGVGLQVLAEESLRRHALGYPERAEDTKTMLPNNGQIHWRAGGDQHMWDPQAIANIQEAARTNSEEAYWQFARHSNANNTSRCTLRGLMKFNDTANGGAISLEEVEPASSLVKRFATGAMSFGSISQEAHETLAVAMNRMGGKSNTGEGGEDPNRFIISDNGDSKRSAIKQVASGRFGVTIDYLTNADEIQIKISQGAKPGEGGELPGDKVDEQIARIRHSTPGVGLISPPPHHDIYSIEDIAQLIHDCKNANPAARISVKLVSEIGVGTTAAGVVKAKADHIVIAGHDGGTGASPITSIKYAGLPWELGLAETHQTLVMNNLRSRVVVQTDGQLKTGRDVAIAALLGAEEFGFATAPLVTLGCIMMRKCHLNTCPVGIATQDPELRAKFQGKPEHVVNYLFMVAEDLRRIMAQLGFRTLNDMVGRADMLKCDDAIDHWKAQGIDLAAVLMPAPKPFPEVETYHTISQFHGLEHALDNELIKLAEPAIKYGEPVNIELPVINTNRVVGTMLSHEVCKKWGTSLPEGSVHIKLNGSAGQSLAAFLAKGISIEVAGDANDYVGKGLSGGRLAIYPPEESSFVAEDNVIVGNVALYGATSGEAYFRGIAAERFCVRNSGASAVIEGVGDHGCEYMTGGRVVVLGETGRNFAAGMSGGIAYVLDEQQQLARNCNLGSVSLERVEEAEDIAELKQLIEQHYTYTGSAVAQRILENWTRHLRHFVKVMPEEYKKVLLTRKKANPDGKPDNLVPIFKHSA